MSYYISIFFFYIRIYRCVNSIFLSNHIYNSSERLSHPLNLAVLFVFIQIFPMISLKNVKYEFIFYQEYIFSLLLYVEIHKYI